MNLFDALVERALAEQPDLAALRFVVEKELLHHDILREMAAAGMLSDLAFIGGTCLRACYGSSRLSEDLDFAGGLGFRREHLSALASTITTTLQRKYDLEVTVTEPVKDVGLVDTWKVRVTTHPARRGLPAQHINIDICAVPSHDRRPMFLRNPYGVDMGTAQLIVQAQSREEILADKFIAFALRPNRLKHRDLWDIAWLNQQGVELPLEFIARKIADHRQTVDAYIDALSARRDAMQKDPALHAGFVNELSRFLQPRVVNETVRDPAFWQYLTELMARESDRVLRHLRGESGGPVFRM